MLYLLSTGKVSISYGFSRWFGYFEAHLSPPYHPHNKPTQHAKDSATTDLSRETETDEDTRNTHHPWPNQILMYGPAPLLNPTQLNLCQAIQQAFVPIPATESPNRKPLIRSVKTLIPHTTRLIPPLPYYPHRPPPLLPTLTSMRRQVGVREQHSNHPVMSGQHSGLRSCCDPRGTRRGQLTHVTADVRWHLGVRGWGRVRVGGGGMSCIDVWKG